MLIPQVLYGTYKTVRSDLRRVVAKLKKSGMLDAVLGSQCIDVSASLGQIFLENPYPGVGTVPAFYVSVLGDLLIDSTATGEVSPEREEMLFQELLLTPWGMSAILGRNNAQFWLMNTPWRLAPYVEAVEHHRAVLDAVGLRFCGGTSGDSQKPWWNFPGGPVYALANLGVQSADLDGLMDQGLMPNWKTLARPLELV